MSTDTLDKETVSLLKELNFAQAKQGCSYLIVSNSAEGRNRMHMDSLGLIPGEAVHVLFSNFAGLVIAIKGSRLALGRPLALYLTVKNLAYDDDAEWDKDASC